MNTIKVSFKNCYGISSLEDVFGFEDQPGDKSYAIYAPNGVMKTSFTKTFEKLSLGQPAEEERYNRAVTCDVLLDDVTLPKEKIFVLRSEIDLKDDSPAITDILVNPKHKARYDSLLVDLDKQKIKLVSALQKRSGVSKNDVEKLVTQAVGIKDFAACLFELSLVVPSTLASEIQYNELFDAKLLEVLNTRDFSESAKMFNDRYQELFNLEGTIYKRGIFNPHKADVAFKTLDKQGFFEGGHRVQMAGDDAPLNKIDLDERLKKINARIEEDAALQKIRTGLSRNAQTQALANLIESMPSNQVEELLGELRPENLERFKRALWAAYLLDTKETTLYLESYKQSKEEILAIEREAEEVAPRWEAAVSLFNQRFIDMPFSLSVTNHTEAVLGKDKAKLQFTFKNGTDTVHWSRSEIKTLSQGEQRALYLLNFIFEVEARKIKGDPTLFVIDDVADSFDYKNKHAIVQYLRDIDSHPGFYQLILTHNYDFFRTLAGTFVHRKRCLMANKRLDGIALTKAVGVQNYFTGVFKRNFLASPAILCATIPFTRNIIEYTNGTDDANYKTLTSLLHWKEDTNQITIRNYVDIYNKVFNEKHEVDDAPIINLLHEQAVLIASKADHDGLNLEDKILLSIAIRLKAEEYLIKKIRDLKKESTYWCKDKNQFGSLAKVYSALVPDSKNAQVLDRVSVTVNSNIHLNSFMYEPILDLDIGHLVCLYKDVNKLLE